MALAVQAAYLKIEAGEQRALVVNTFEDSRVEIELDGQTVSLTQSSQFPRAGEGTLTFHMAKPATFGLLVRVPKWVRCRHGPAISSSPWTAETRTSNRHRGLS